MLCYGFFVTFKNLDFRALFCPYLKRDEPKMGSDGSKTSSMILSKIYEPIRDGRYRASCS